jgi:hypothetical protein
MINLILLFSFTIFPPHNAYKKGCAKKGMMEHQVTKKCGMPNSYQYNGTGAFIMDYYGPTVYIYHVIFKGNRVVGVQRGLGEKNE